MDDAVGSLLDEVEDSTARTAAQIRSERQYDDLRIVLTSRAGRRFIWRLLEEGRVFHSTFHTDAGVMAFGEGKRAGAIALINELVARHYDAYLQMQHEYQEELT